MRVFRATRFFVDFFDGQKSQSQSRLERQCLIENQIINIQSKIKHEIHFNNHLIDLLYQS